MIDTWFIGFSRIDRTGSGIKRISDSLVPPKKINNRSILIFFLKTFKFFFAIMHFMKLLRKIFLIFCVIFWGITAFAQTFPEKGIGQWEKLPFADVRLMSCTTGFKNRSIIVGGLQIKMNEGWVLARPTLDTLSDKGVINYPIRPNSVQTQNYTGTFLIPIVYPYTPNQKDFSFGVVGNLKACQKENCSDSPIFMKLPLDENESKYTSYCAYIMDELKNTPIPAFDMGKGQWLDNNHAWISFKAPRVNQAFLQNESGLDFRILKTIFLKNEVRFKVTYPQQWDEKTMKDWILITNQGIFRVPIVLTQNPLPKPGKDKPWGMFIFGGILLFICSPFFILFGTSFLKNKKQLRQQCVHAIIATTALITLFCLIYRYFSNIYETDILLHLAWLIMGITLIFTPRFVWWTALLFIVWPKPILKQMSETFSLYYLIPWLIMWNILPFGLLYKYADFWGKKGRFSLKNDFFLHNFFFLLPTIFLMIGSIYNYVIEIPYENLSVIDKTRINVVCEKKDCQEWKAYQPSICFIDPKADFGKTLKDKYIHKKNIVIFNDNQNEIVLTDITPKKLEKYLTGLQNYHAQYRPVDPPIHSGDDRHDLSPNAK